MKDHREMPSKEILEQYGVSEEELKTYLELLDDAQNSTCNSFDSKECDCNDESNCKDDCTCQKDDNCDCKTHHDYNHCDCDDHCSCCTDSCENDDCDCENDDCDCHSHTGAKPKLVKMCVLEEGVPCCNCGACNMCDLDPNKVCDNCGKCLDTLNTDEKGFVHVPIDKIITGEGDDELQALLAAYGLSDDDDDEDDEDEDNQ